MHAHEELNRLRANPTQALLPAELAPIRTCRDELSCSTAIRLAQEVRSLQIINGRLLARAESYGRHTNISAGSGERKRPARATVSAPARSANWEAFLAYGNGGRA
jgi:hypothetical protein